MKTAVNWTPWTQEEKRYAEECVIENLPALKCLALFPGRSESSVVSRFNAIRIELGMRAAGDKKKYRVLPGRKPSPPPPVDPLLRRQLETGQHFICDHAQFAAVCATVGLAA